MLRKAHEDGAFARKLADEPESADSVVGFHAQQTVKKALKAILAARGIEYALTHDLRHLVDEAQVDLHRSTPSPSKQPRRLTSWTVDSDTANTVEGELDRASALETTDALGRGRGATARELSAIRPALMQVTRPPLRQQILG